jgi:hypothetical protein
MRRVAVVGQVVRAMGTRSEMLDPLQPAWNKAWSGWSKWSKHFQRLVNKKTDCLFFKHPPSTHSPWQMCEKTRTTWTTRTTLSAYAFHRPHTPSFLGQAFFDIPPCLAHPGPSWPTPPPPVPTTKPAISFFLGLLPCL